MDKQFVFGDYVLTGVENAFNKKMSWWLSKKWMTRAQYCFSTEGSDASVKRELDYQLKSIDVYIDMFDGPERGSVPSSSRMWRLYHGTTEENAKAMLAEKKAKEGELWLANDPDIARAYGPCVLAVSIPSCAKLDAYPLRSGCLEHMEAPYAEPAEFRLEFYGKLHFEQVRAKKQKGGIL